MRFSKYLNEENNLDILYENEEIDKIIDELFNIKSTIHELSARSDVFPQIWGNVTAEDDEEKIDQAKKIYTHAKELASSVKRKFFNLLRRVSQFKNSKVLVDIKPLESFVDKAINRYPKKGKGASNITDVLRSAVLVNTKEEVEKTVQNIKKRFQVARHKEKTAESDPKYGYFGSHHFYVKVGKILAEIQVMTKKLWAYKDQAHKIYNKYRSVDVADKNVEKMDTNLSKQLFKLANIDKQKGRKKGKPQLTKREKKYKKNFAEYM